MSCYRPLAAHIDRSSGGRVRMGGYHAGEQGDRIELPCGRCVGCRMDKSRSWSLRCMHEAQLYDASVFVTLDYAPEHLPSSLSLEYVDFQLFMKRLRRAVSGVSRGPNGDFPIRFFCAGEYGEKYKRPHYHALLFNCWFKDSVKLANGTFRSGLAERLWGKGHVVIGSVTPQSAAYCAGYTLSKKYGRAAPDFYEDVVNLETGEVTSRRPEFCEMSRKPGIGAWWYEKFSADLFSGDFAVSKDGFKYKVPRYYWERFRRENPLAGDEIAAGRLERARAKPPEESSPRRRADREAVASARLMLYGDRAH